MQPPGKDRQEWMWRMNAMILLALFLSLQVLPFVRLKRQTKLLSLRAAAHMESITA